jgi:hypothetical protein
MFELDQIQQQIMETEAQKEDMVGSFPGELIENAENQKKDNKKAGSAITAGGVIFVIFLILWVLLGIGAFIASLVCFGYSGSLTEKILGLVIAFMIGPFYWLYFYFNKNYCGKNQRNNRNIRNK